MGRWACWARYRAANYLSLEAVGCERTVGCTDCRLQSMRPTARDLNPSFDPSRLCTTLPPLTDRSPTPSPHRAPAGGSAAGGACRPHFIKSAAFRHPQLDHHHSAAKSCIGVARASSEAEAGRPPGRTQDRIPFRRHGRLPLAETVEAAKHNVPGHQATKPAAADPVPAKEEKKAMDGAPELAAAKNVLEEQKASHRRQESSASMLDKGPSSVCSDCGVLDEPPTLHGDSGEVKDIQSLDCSGGNQEKNTSQKSSMSESFAAAKASDGANSLRKTSGSAKISDRADFPESGKSSMCRPSAGSNISDESSCSSMSSSTTKPHKGSDSRWEAIRVIRSRDGILGLSHFRLLKKLGCGDIGSVYLSELNGTKSYFAMKVMDKGSLASRKKLLRAQTEREILQSLDHPFLPTLYTHFETDKFSCLVMEFCPGGDLHTLRQRQPGKYFSEQAAKFYVAEVLLALEYLHMLGIIYRDLKPENVLVREDGHIMLSDFDLSLRCDVSPTVVKSANPGPDALQRSNQAYCVQPACIEPSCIQPACVAPTTCFGPRFFSSKSKSKKEKKPKPKPEIANQVSPLPELIAEPTDARSMSFVGTHEYLAPEIIKGEGHGSAVDWWTFGIFLYELLFGKTPFKGSGNRATLFNVVGQPLRFPESPIVSFSARDLIRGLLVKDPQHRLGYKRGTTEIKQHPFFEGMNWALIRCASPPDVPKPVELDRPPKPAPANDRVAPAANQKGPDNFLEFEFF